MDVTIPTAGLNLNDFLQLVITTNDATDEFTASIRDTFGNVQTISATADILIGVNGSGLFTWASGALGGAVTNLGGGTNGNIEPPAGLTEFTGEIAVVNIYNSILETADIQAAFDRVATIGQGPGPLAVTEVSFDDASDQLAITWNSISGESYIIEFSADLQPDQWFELAGPFTADSGEMSEILSLPPNRPRFFVRVVVDTP